MGRGSLTVPQPQATPQVPIIVPTFGPPIAPVGWAFDPCCLDVAAGTTRLTAGLLYFIRVAVTPGVPINKIFFWVNAAGVNVTAKQNFAMIFNAAGTQRLGQSAEITEWALGIKEINLTVPITTNESVVLVALYVNAETTPAMQRGLNAGNEFSTLLNAGLTGIKCRWGIGQSGLKLVLPTAILEPAEFAQAIWCGLA